MTDTMLNLMVVFIAVVFALGALWHGYERQP
jgi:hypothetical protein